MSIRRGNLVIAAKGIVRGDLFKTFVVDDTVATDFNSTNDEITITSSFVDLSGNTITLEQLSLGDNIIVKQLDVPDRYVMTKSGSSVKLGKLETTKVTIPTSINGFSGGSLTSPLVIYGGGGSNASKINLDNTRSGQITDSSTNTIFGFLSNNTTTLTVGSTDYDLNLRGIGNRPQYKSNDLALVSDLSSYLPLSGGTITGTITSNAGSGIRLKTKITSDNIVVDSSKFLIYGSEGASSSLYTQITDASDSNVHYYKLLDNTGKLYSDNKQVATTDQIPTITATSGSESITDGTNTLNVVTRDTAQIISGTKTVTNGLIVNIGTSNLATNDVGIRISNSDASKVSRISGNNGGDIGIYACSNLYIRPGFGTAQSYGIKMSTSDMSPTTNKNMSLGTTTIYWNDIYGTTIYQNGKQVANAEDIPTTTDSVTQSSTAALTSGGAYTALLNKISQGGTITSPLTLGGGDTASSGKIILDAATAGQITNNGNATLFGFASSNADTLTVGAGSFKLALRGYGTRPTFNSNDLALSSDIPSNTDILNSVYPIGSIYITVGTGTTGTTSPASFLGGTWARLPDGYTLWTASSGAYDGTNGIISAGLPNIKGGYDMRTTVNGATFVNTSGGFTTTQDGSSTKWEHGHSTGSTSKYLATVRFNAHDSNSIYSDSVTTVQPPALKVYMWRRVPDNT